MNKTDYKDMWVFIERDGDSVLPVSLELCSETRRLCDASGEKLVAVIVGSISDGELQRVLDCGVDKVIHVTGTGYDYFNNDAYTNLFTVLCRKYRPTAVMVGGTINGRDFAPRFAARLGTGCTSDAVNHVTGFSDADVVVAVNTDPEAAIFNYCTYGIVGDMDEVCEAMLAKLGE